MIKSLPSAIASLLLISCVYSESISDDFTRGEEARIVSTYGDNNQFYSMSSLVKDIFFNFQETVSQDGYSMFECGNIDLHIFESSRLVNSNKENMPVLIVSLSGKTVVVDRDTLESEFVIDIIETLREILCDCGETSDSCDLAEEEVIENVLSSCNLSFEVTDDRVWYP
tara:strand:- start:1508 stop:2014 length:507 start_codon:yes stop_codon:yes gene_type:complete